MRTTTDPKTTYLRYRVSSEYKSKIEQKAKEKRMSISEFLRAAVQALEEKEEAKSA